MKTLELAARIMCDIGGAAAFLCLTYLLLFMIITSLNGRGKKDNLKF